MAPRVTGSRSRPCFRSSPWSFTMSIIMVESDGNARRPILTLTGSWAGAGGATARVARPAASNTLDTIFLMARLPRRPRSGRVDDGVVRQLLEVLRRGGPLEPVPDALPLTRAPGGPHVDDPPAAGERLLEDAGRQLHGPRHDRVGLVDVLLDERLHLLERRDPPRHRGRRALDEVLAQRHHEVPALLAGQLAPRDAAVEDH